MGERGFTLVEVVVAMLLMAIALVGLAATVPFGAFAVTDGGLQTTAAGLAQEPIDAAKRTPFASLPSLAASRAAVPSFAGLEREVLVSDYGAPADCSGSPCTTSCPIVSAVPTCRLVEVRVYHTGRIGEIVTTLTSILSQ
jgi:prepilin-type N-terminal cleavage/methylation domain-containing protein